jgi:hypothetical protein
MKLFHILSALFFLLCFPVDTSAKIYYPLYADTVTTNEAVFFNDEKEAITNAINKYLDAAGIKIADLNVTGEEGSKTASGKVSFFGFDNIDLKASLLSGNKIKSISTTFPAQASMNADKLTKFLSGRSLSSFLPKSFPLNTDLSIKDFSLEFDDKGDSLSKFNLNFGIGTYTVNGFDGFAINGMSVGFVLDKPTSPQRKATAVVSGDGNIGAVPVTLSANMSSAPDDLMFSFTAGNISIPSLLNTFMSDGKANSLLKFIPESFKSKEITSVTASFNPTNKNFTALAQASFGEAELQFNGATEESKSEMLFAIAPPAGFKFSQLANALAPLDAIELSGTALIISTLADPGAKCSLSALKDEGEMKVEAGVNIFSSVKFSSDLQKVLKVSSLKLRGTVNENFTNMSLAAALKLNIPMGDNIKMTDVVFGIRLGTVNPVLFSIGGKIEAKVGDDLVGFNAAMEFSPTDQQIQAMLFMEAMKRRNGVVLKGKLIEGNKSDIPEWTEPFGIPGVGLRRLGVSAGIDFKNPILISSLGFTAAARLGTVTNRLKHIEGDATIVINIANPTKSLVDVTMKNMTIISMIDAFVENANIQGAIRTALNTGVDSGRVLVVPVDGMVAFGKTYNKGIAFGGQLSIAGIKGYADFALNDNGFKAAGAIAPIDWGNGAFQLKGRTTDKAQFSFAFAKNTPPAIFIDGKISLLGISSETSVMVDDKGFEFTTSGKIANVFEATLEGKGTSFTQTGGGIYVRAALRNDLVSTLNKMVTGKINEAIQTTKTTLQQTRTNLEAARNNIKDVDDRIAKRLAEVTTKTNADLQNMRNEAQRAMNERMAFIVTCRNNNAASYKRINQLGSWPWELVEKGALYTAIAANETAIQSAQVAYDGYAGTVNGLADVGKSFPKDIQLTDLYTEKTAKQAAYATALAGVDIAQGVSVTTLEATKYVMNGVLGGVFDVKSAEFSGTFGLNNQYKINTALNFTLAGNPYNMVTELDFTNLASSASKIATDVLAGNLIKPGFAKTFALELKKPITSTPLTTTATTLYTTTNIVVTPPQPPPPLANNANDYVGKFIRIENMWKLSNAMHIEEGPLVAAPIKEGAWSAQWVLKPVPGTNYFFIENRWKPTLRLNVETGPLTASVIHGGAFSAHWDLKKVSGNLYRIENRYTAKRINIETGKVECTTINDGAWSAQWYIRVAGM